MARPEKVGLDYFPLNVDIFEDDKLKFVEARFNEKGELIAVKLLCKIYKAGYFIKWDEDTALLFAKGAGKNVTDTLVKDVVFELVKRNFFDKIRLEEFGILTSNGIQNRYVNICKLAKRKSASINPKYAINELTTDESELTPEEIPINSGQSTQRKVKESKVKKRKEKSTPPQNSNLFRAPVIPTIEKVEEVFLSNGGDVEMAKKFYNKWEAVGWYKNNSPITNFSNLVYDFIDNWNKNLKNVNGTDQTKLGTSEARVEKLKTW